MIAYANLNNIKKEEAILPFNLIFTLGALDLNHHDLHAPSS